MEIEKYLRSAYSNQFKSYYGRKPTEEQLNVYMRFFLRKELDANKVASVCNIPFNEQFLDRDAFIRQFKIFYECMPNDEQLDVFISYGLGVYGISVTDVWDAVRLGKISEHEENGPANF